MLACGAVASRDVGFVMGTYSAVRCAAALLPLLLLIPDAPGLAQPSIGGITWTVKSRFRLFKNESDFNALARFHRPGGVLAEETALAIASNGDGWVAQHGIVAGSRLCLDPARPCRRIYAGDDTGVAESYLNPASHRVEVEPDGAAPPGALCTWRLVTEGDVSTAVVRRDRPCGKHVFEVPYGKTTQVQLFVATHPEDAQPTVTADIKVRDILIAGLGDSTASGEGNPDVAIGLGAAGFCFHRSGVRQYWRPSRAGYDGNRSCSFTKDEDALAWSGIGARWMDHPCHRSLYSYQARVALELAIENPHIAVTYLPLACSGATIDEGMLDRQDVRERCAPGQPGPCPKKVPGQIERLRDILGLAHRNDRDRKLDLVLLTVGANDIGFSGLVANVMIDRTSVLQQLPVIRNRVISTVAQARTRATELPGKFATLRRQLRPLVGNRLERVVYVSYGHPALHDNGRPCGTTRLGFDVHPAFTVDGSLLRTTSDFVNDEFFPRLKALASCERGGGCSSLDADRMTFVDGHQAEFKHHGFCAQAGDDPAFDRTCFTDGRSFQTDPRRAHEQPLTCSQRPNAFRPYAPRQRWIRTANDSYFAAMTYPYVRYLQPSDIHDAVWGVFSAVYGGAMHPTAQGYAAMADAALPAARRLLGLPQVQTSASRTGSP
jgi:lysophospholipase L1-like esterase